MQKLREEKGITLIALVITIIVMLILVGVSVTVALKGGLFTTAKQAAEGTTSKRNEELELSSGKVEINGEWYNSIDEYVNGSGNGAGGEEYEAISVETDCVGYYVDLGGEEGPEGVVYIDIANTESGSWNGESYTITNETEGLKEYYVSAEQYEGALGTKPVLSLVPGSTGTERFHVMALEDETTADYTTFYWYYNAFDNGISDYATLTGTGVRNEEGVSIGKTNTANMMAKWNAEAYGTKHTRDMWGVVEDGWYIPSKDEWVAFGSSMGITSSNYSGKGLSQLYWSSSLKYSDSAWYVMFDFDGWVDFADINGSAHCCYVRLSTTL